MGQREQQLAAVAEAHYRWSTANADRVPFNGEDNAGSRDYNVEHVDIEASGELQELFVSKIRGQSTSTLPSVGAMGDNTENTDGG